MEWKEFGIEQVADLCGITMKNDKIGAAEVKAQCPFCNDSHYHLYLNTEKNQWTCFRCGAKGNDVSLYAMMNGISNKEAVDELSKRLGNTVLKIVKVNTHIKSIKERHNVYYDMLQNLRLNKNHHISLLKRGLTDDNIQRFMYKSLPESEYDRHKLVEVLSEKYDLYGIPGFYREYGEWKMYSPKFGGFLIPVCDKDGYIQGMQIRLNSDNVRYRWFSTNEYPEGTGVPSWVHVVGNTLSDTAYLTEGALKADVASSLTGGKLFVAVAGVNAVNCLPDTLRELKLKKVYETFDMDKQVNVYVRKALNKINYMLNEQGIEVETCTWNPWYKGIDDYCLYRKQAA